MELLKRHLPAKLRAYDRKLLLKKPALWAIQLHTLAFWAILLTAISVLASLLPTVSLENIVHSNMGFPIGIAFSILALLLFGGWVWLQRSYIVEQGFGKFSLRLGQTYLFSYIAALFLLSLPIFLPTAILDYRYSQLVSDRQFSEDINTLNRYQLFFPLENSENLNYYEAVERGFDEGYFDLNPFQNPLGGRDEAAVFSSSGGAPMQIRERLQDLSEASVQKYIDAAQRYLGEEDFSPDPNKAVEQFKSGTALYDDDYFYKLSERTNSLGSIKAYGSHKLFSGNYSAATSLIVGIFIFSHLMLIVRYIGLKQSIISVAVNALAFVVLILLGGMLGVFGVGIGSLVTLITLPAAFFISIRIINQSSKKGSVHPWSLAILGSGHFYIINIIQIILGALVFLGSYLGHFQPLYILAASILAILGSVYIILPMFHRGYIRIKAAPPRV